MGDIFLFKALVEIGPRIAMLIFSLSAPTAALIGWLFLDEVYVLHQWAGMMVTLFGVGIVILEKNQNAISKSKLKVRHILLKYNYTTKQNTQTLYLQPFKQKKSIQTSLQHGII